MLLEIAGIGLDPKIIAEAGAYSLGGVELAKRYIPSLFPEGTSEQRAIVLPVIAGIVISLIGGAPVTLAGLATTAANFALGSAVAGTVHDRIVCPVLDPVLDKLPGQPVKAESK